MPSSSTVAGLAAAVLAAGCFEFGYVLQAAAARDEAAGSGGVRRLITDAGWRRASALVVVGLALQLVALALAPLSVVQPALVLGLGLLLVLAGRRLGERPSLAQRVAVGVAGAGVLLVVLGGGDDAGGGGTSAAVALPAAGLVLSLAAGRGFGQARALVLAAGLGDAVAVLAAKLAIGAGTADPLAAIAWLTLVAAAGLAGLDAEMRGLRVLPAGVVGPLVLVLQAGVPVALAPWVLGEHWASPPAVVAGLAVVVGAAFVLGRARAALS